MHPTGATTYRPGLLPVTRALLVLFALLTLLGVAALFVLSDRTASTFAWTIEPPATAAFLGAGYASGTVLVLLALRDGRWASVRAPLVTILAFTVLTLGATLRHIDRFHFGADGALARGAAWFWTVVYIVVPLGMAGVLALQERRRLRTWRWETPHGHRLPVAVRVALVAEGAVMAVVGMALYVVPTTAASLWPWSLTPLTGRVIASWLLAYALATVLVTAQDDLERTRGPAVAYATFGIGALVVALRFTTTIDWSGPRAPGYLVLAAAVVVTGAVTYLAARRPGRRRERGEHAR